MKNKITTELNPEQLRGLEEFLADKTSIKKFNCNALVKLLEYDKQCIDFTERLMKIAELDKDAISENAFILRYGKIEGLKRLTQNRINLKNRNKNYIEKYGIEKYNESCKKRGNTLDNHIEKYGEEEGTRRYNEKINNWKKAYSLSGHIEKYGEEEGTKQYNEKIERSGKVKRLSGYIEKYGEEEGRKKYELKNSLISHGNSLERYIEKYGEEEGRKKWDIRVENSKITKEKMISLYGEEEGEFRYKQWRKNSRCTLENFIKKYGEEEGEKRYKNWVIKTHSSQKLFKDRYSKISQKLFFALLKYIEDKTSVMFMEYTNKEFFIYNKSLKKIRFYDFKYKNKIIEFNGDFWHCNPETYDPDFFNFKNGYAKDIWKRDEEKTKIANDAGYEILTIWLSEYKKDSTEVINKCLNFLEK